MYPSYVNTFEIGSATCLKIGPVNKLILELNAWIVNFKFDEDMQLILK